MDWLATAELLDDHEHTIESRLKFWAFDRATQAYTLNTQIELPHENGIRTLEFSTPHSFDNLLCATSGEYDVKIWALDDSKNYKSELLVHQLFRKFGFHGRLSHSIQFNSIHFKLINRNKVLVFHVC